jgi:hypothetical protein
MKREQISFLHLGKIPALFSLFSVSFSSIIHLPFYLAAIILPFAVAANT